MIKKLLFLGLTLFLISSQISDYQCIITGKVIDDNGNPLIGASVLVKSTSKATLTDADGNFSIGAPDCKTALEVSYIGYTTKEITPSAPNEVLNIVLSAEKEQLEEVVVTGQDSKMKRMFRGKPAQTQAYSYSTSGIVPNASYPTPMAESPVVYNTEDYSHIAENRFLEVNQNPLSTFSIDVDAASYSNMRRFIQNGMAPPPDAIRVEEMINYFNYDYPQPTSDQAFTIASEVSDCPWNPDNKLLHIGLQGKKVPTENLPASNLVFLIDVSGSMNQPNKLPLLKSSFKLLVDQLREQDRVAIVVYAGAAGKVLSSTSGSKKTKIKEALDELQAGGSTAGGAGIQLAYKIAREHYIKNGNNRVILATDGDFNIGESSDAALVRLIEEKRESGIFLTVLGFGMGNYKDNKMQQLANKGNGNHAYIDNINEARKVLVSEFGGTLFTIAKDVKIQLEFNPTHVQGYRLIGYENRMLDKEDFNDDKKDAGELGSGHTVTALYEIIPVGVKSSFLSSVDDLKYQKNKSKTISKLSEELLTVKLRYKEPDGAKSKLIEQSVMDRQIELDRSSDNFRWAAAVAAFGMLLRDSEFKAKANYRQAIELAKSAKGKDENGYRQELINMMETMKSIALPEVAEK